MKTFNQFLTEGRDAPLYHGTDVDSAIRILNANKLVGSYNDHNAPTISLTRSIRYAQHFAKDKFSDTVETIVFELDQRKLSQTYKIVPYNYFSDDVPNEYEEVVFTKGIDNFNKYLLKVHVFEKPGRPIKGNVILNHPKLFYKGSFVNK